MQYDRAISHAAQRYDISPFLLVGILKLESDMGTATVSRTSDYGPMQINRWWLPRLHVTKKAVENPHTAMVVASIILNHAKREHPGRCWWSAYNSPTARHRRVYERSVFKALGKMGVKANCTSEFLNNWNASLPMAARYDQQLASLRR